MSAVTQATKQSNHRYLLPRTLMRVVIWLLLSTMSLAASAQTRAWLDRDRIALGETVTLNIETTSAAAAEPDYAPLQADFSVSGHTSRREFESINGRNSMRTLYAVALRPRRDGVLTVPALGLGSERTQPLPLVVTPTSGRTPARAGDDVFIESEADDADPYVQQSVGWVVRLYSAAPLVSGQLDQPAPEGASLQRVGDDAQYQRDVGGRRYSVVERRFLLVPERSGALTIPPASFEGRGAGGFFDDLFGGNGGALQAQSAPRVLQVRPVPADAPQPWLPLQDLQLRYQSTPQELRAGAAATLVVEATADGATAAQMPELQLPAMAGVQVFAEPVQADERFVDGRPRAKLTRRFSLVPSRTGKVDLGGMRLSWWDVRAGMVRTATLPALSWTALPAAAAPTPTPDPVTASPAAPAEVVADAGSPLQVIQGASRGWVLATLLFAALWLFTLVWGLHRGDARAAAEATAGESTPGGSARPTASGAIGLRQALDRGALGDVADALCAAAQPRARDLDDVIARLADDDQRDAVQALQRARWGRGDGVAARQALRKVFASGPRWRERPADSPSPLPPLYPAGPASPLNPSGGRGA
ncbi:BatD family protein [Lysobacter sp. S4-A87]|uniref:BatD family protein n=1 Tax=Lysobacter sp. S4-A87 TaxID=2925843 RepID=UPI001F53A0A3|nr:BatD family protein [Lysobacter sp. S4-A87]UNK50901.1 BatD family protein [Lysobacter sp. S4-A87]